MGNKNSSEDKYKELKSAGDDSSGRSNNDGHKKPTAIKEGKQKQSGRKGTKNVYHPVDEESVARHGNNSRHITDQQPPAARGGRAGRQTLIDVEIHSGVNPKLSHIRRQRKTLSQSRESILESVIEDEEAPVGRSYADIQTAIARGEPIDGYDRYRLDRREPLRPASTHQNSRIASTPALFVNPSPQLCGSQQSHPNRIIIPRPRPRSASYEYSSCLTRPPRDMLNSVFPVEHSHISSQSWVDHNASFPDIHSSGYFDASGSSFTGTLPSEGFVEMCSYHSGSYRCASAEDLDEIRSVLSESVKQLNTVQSSLETLNKKVEETENGVIQLTASRNNVQPS